MPQSQRHFPNDWPKPIKISDEKAQISDSEIIELAWCDETSFDSIKAQTGMAEKDIITLMQRNLKPSSFRLWRKRVSGRKAKHESRLRD